MKRIAMAIVIAAMAAACLPEGGGPRTHDAGVDVPDAGECGGCERGTCERLPGYGYQCADECEFQPCEFGNYCTKIYHEGDDLPEYKCTSEALLDG